MSRDFYDSIKDSPSWNYWNGARYRRIDLIPCGKCLNCQLRYASQWATDCLLEKQYWRDNECWFLTLTYSDEFLPSATYKTEDGKEYKGISLSKEDLQKFWKRLRKHYKTKCKYIAAGEYGTQTSRPHYHAIVFGLPVDVSELKYYGIGSNGDTLWTNEELNKVWGKGQVIIGSVTFRSVSYVVRYTIKKWKHKDEGLNKILGRTPEFLVMSQGIAKKYYGEHQNDLVSADSVITNEGLKPLPRRFLNMIKEIDENLYKDITYNHKQMAEIAEKQKQSQTDKCPEERRITEEEAKKFLDIRR